MMRPRVLRARIPRRPMVVWTVEGRIRFRRRGAIWRLWRVGNYEQ